MASVLAAVLASPIIADLNFVSSAIECSRLDTFVVQYPWGERHRIRNIPGLRKPAAEPQQVPAIVAEGKIRESLLKRN